MLQSTSEVGDAIAVPIYDSLGENAVEYIVNHAGVELIYLDVAKLPAYVKVRRSWSCRKICRQAVSRDEGVPASAKVDTTSIIPRARFGSEPRMAGLQCAILTG